jgi:hypothetical protein
LNFEIDILGRALAAIIYVAGLCAVLYVAYFVPYFNPEEVDESMSVTNNWGLLVTGMALILVASVLWAVRFSSDASHNGENGKRLGDENE